VKKIIIILTFVIVCVLFVSFTSRFSQSVYASTPYACTWTGDGTNNNFSNQYNWSGCNDNSPQPEDNDNLIFSSISKTIILNNDISNLQLNSILFSGPYSGNLTIEGSSFNLSNGIVDSSSGINLANEINTKINLTNSQTFDISSSNDYLTLNTINLDIYSLTLNANSNNGFSINGGLTGSGNLTVDGVGNLLNMTSPSPNFDGSTFINNGVLVQIADPSLDSLGDGLITINNGGALEIESPNSTATFNNPLNINGLGDPDIGAYGAVISCLGNLDGCTTSNNTTLYLTGKITSGDSEVVNGDHKVIGYAYIANFMIYNCGLINDLTAAPESNTNVEFTCPIVTSPVSTNNKIINSPNTGFGVSTNNPIKTIITFILLSICILVVGKLMPYYRK